MTYSEIDKKFNINKEYEHKILNEKRMLIKNKNIEFICKNSDIFGGDLYKLSNTTLRYIKEELENVKNNTNFT